MDINKIKELEDIKIELQKQNIEFCNLVDIKKKNYNESVFNDFQQFFKSKDFIIRKQENELEAKYGDDFKIKIKKDKYEESYKENSLYSIWKLNVSMDKYITEYNILLGEPKEVAVTYPEKKMSFDEREYFSDDMLNSLIKDKKEQLENIKKRIENFRESKWGFNFRYKSHKNAEHAEHAYSKYEFETMTGLLGNMFSYQ